MDQLEDKSRVELVELAKSVGIKSVTIKRKDQLIAEIRAKKGGSVPAARVKQQSSDTAQPVKRGRGRPRLTPVVIDNPEAPVELSADDLIPIGRGRRQGSQPKALDHVTLSPSDRIPIPVQPRRDRNQSDNRSKYYKGSKGEPQQQNASQGQQPQNSGDDNQGRRNQNRRGRRGRPPKNEQQQKQQQQRDTQQRDQQRSGQEQRPNQNAQQRNDNRHQGQRPQQQQHQQQQQSQPNQQHRQQRPNQPQMQNRGQARNGFLPAIELPVSNAPTLRERLQEIEPQLGGYIIAEGTLEIMSDGNGLLRSVHYNFLPGPDDIMLTAQMVRQHKLRPGDCVVGVVRPPDVDERYFNLVRIEGINGRIPEEVAERADFEDLLPIYPDKRFVLETKANNYLTRIIDLFAPLGKGQRGLIVAQPKTGKTTILRNIANSVSTNNPETRIIILLVDERPEEVTEMERSVIDAEVVASTFDSRPENHVRVAEIVFEKARRLVECGQDVLILMDSITRLARAYNICASNTGRTMSGGIDAQALKVPRQLFSSARNIEGGGSLTIIATALIETGSRMDDVIFEEFKGTGNMEIVLDRRLADRRIFPAIDVFKSGTRREELLVPDEEREKVVLLRRYLSTMNPVEAIEFLLDKMKGTYDNRHFLISMNQ